MIRFVFFDVGGVLKVPSQETKNDFPALVGINLEKYASFRNKHHSDIQKGHMNQDQYFAKLKKEFRLSAPNLAMIWKQLLIQNYVEYPKTIEWATHLKEKYTIGIISNRSDLSSGIATKTRLFEIFQPNVFLSFQIGLMKPDRAIFTYVNKKTKSKPEECILIDDKEENVKGAQKAGWYGILHRNLTQTKKEFNKIIHDSS